jgi:transposase InsO family protein
MEDVYELLGTSRQGHHQRMRHQKEQDGMMDRIKGKVQAYRKEKDARAGSRSLFYNLDIKGNFQIGVSKFEHLMSAYGLTLLPLRTRVVTTQSSLQSWNYTNLANGLKVNGINQIVAGDLTYIFIGGSLFYLFCLTDLYSYRIVGHCVSERQRAKDAKIALEAWFDLRGRQAIKGCIHHTDGGSQYYSRLYLNELSNQKVRPSVAQNCLQNGYAEQKNNLLKNHFIPTVDTQNLKQLQMELLRIVAFYNHERKQQALGWRTPVHYEANIKSLAVEKREVKTLHDFHTELNAT